MYAANSVTQLNGTAQLLNFYLHYLSSRWPKKKKSTKDKQIDSLFYMSGNTFIREINAIIAVYSLKDHNITRSSFDSFIASLICFHPNYSEKMLLRGNVGRCRVNADSPWPDQGRPNMAYSLMLHRVGFPRKTVLESTSCAMLDVEYTVLWQFKVLENNGCFMLFNLLV